MCVINESDFDAAIHADAAAGSPSAPEPEGEAPAEVPVEADITALNTADAAAIIANANGEELDVLEAEELASEKREGGRKGVLSAIAERREELEA